MLFGQQIACPEHMATGQVLERTVPLSSSSPGRCLGLDLLRAIAILMVLVSHWTSHFGYWFGVHLPGMVDALGDTGVEIFFALSGFLIGRILIGIAAARPTWADYRVFMIRRAMRTLPLYFLWLAILLCIFPPHQDAVAAAMRFVTLTQNLIAEMPADYYYVVTWSLAIEEWFYLLFGASLIVLSRQLGGSRALLWCLAIFMLAPLMLRLGYAERGALVFFRIDEIAYGVLMARLYLRRNGLFRHPWMSLTAGLALIGAALCNILPLPEFLAVPLTSNVEVIGGALCLPAALRLSHAAKWFEAPVRWIASRSYALYIIHLTILVDIAETRLFEPGLLPALGCAVLAVAVPFGLAELSYRFLEAPILMWRLRQDRAIARVSRSDRSLFVLAGAAK
jgi:peptidoglycan/LPS O-acetylase OafA/YrhL